MSLNMFYKSVLYSYDIYSYTYSSYLGIVCTLYPVIFSHYLKVHLVSHRMYRQMCRPYYKTT